MKHKPITYYSVQRSLRLTDTEVKMAEELDISPEGILHMQANRHEPWKDPAALRIRRLHEAKYGSIFSK